jgi:hypothetical protein
MSDDPEFEKWRAAAMKLDEGDLSPEALEAFRAESKSIGISEQAVVEIEQLAREATGEGQEARPEPRRPTPGPSAPVREPRSPSGPKTSAGKLATRTQRHGRTARRVCRNNSCNAIQHVRRPSERIGIH